MPAVAAGGRRWLSDSSTLPLAALLPAWHAPSTPTRCSAVARLSQHGLLVCNVPCDVRCTAAAGSCAKCLRCWFACRLLKPAIMASVAAPAGTTMIVFFPTSTRRPSPLPLITWTSSCILVNASKVCLTALSQCGAIARRAAACCIGLHTRLLWPHGLVIRCFDAAFISREAQLMQSMAGAISAEVQQQLQQHLLASHHRKQELAQAAVSQLASSHLSAISQGAPHIAT